jgi:uncharacterized LabA/DUF88 family protein
MARRQIARAAILIDWRNLPGLMRRSPVGVPADRYIRQAIFAVQEQCAKILDGFTGSQLYRCTIRVYDGWHTRREPTPTRIVFDRILRGRTSFFSRTIGRISFPSDPEFGDQLVHDQRYGTLFDTNRAQGQKMVDTAIVSDALALLSTRYADMVMIISDDDDFVPALITGEALGYSLYLVRQPGRNLEAVTDVRHHPGIVFWM